MMNRNATCRWMLLWMLLWVAHTAAAQWKVGLQAGYTDNSLVTSSSYAYDRNYSNRGGFTIGVPVRYELMDWLAVQAEVSFVQKNYEMHRSNLYRQNHYDYTNHFLNVPLFARFSFGGEKLRGYTLLGAYAGYWMSSRVKGSQMRYFDHESEDHDFFSGYDFDEKVAFDSRRDNRFDAGLAAGIGLQYQLTPLLEVFAEGRYYYGLTDLQKAYMLKQIPRYNNTLALQVGMMFTIVK